MRSTALLLFAFLFAGCQSQTSVGSFTPYRAVSSEKSTDAAVHVQHGDKRMLAKAGAHYVGELEVDDAGRAPSEAAKVGATHFVLVGGRLALFRVEPDRWNELPEQLRPTTTTANEPVSTTVLTSAPMR